LSLTHFSAYSLVGFSASCKFLKTTTNDHDDDDERKEKTKVSKHK
jgi:hypothetical protein